MFDQKTGGALRQRAPEGSPVPYNTMPVSFAFDYGEAYNNRPYSVGIVAVKCEDLPDIEGSSLRFQRPIMFFPPEMDSEGKPIGACKHVNGCLLPLLQDLQRLGPKVPDNFEYDAPTHLGSLKQEELGTGIPIWPNVFDSRKRAVRSASTFICHILAIGWHADAPARAKLLNTLSHTAILGCSYCHMTQTEIKGNVKKFMGYSAPSTITRGLLEGKDMQMVGATPHIKWCTYFTCAQPSPFVAFPLNYRDWICHRRCAMMWN